MISLQTLTTFQPEAVEIYLPGYVSPEKYQVERRVSPDGEDVTLALRRVALDPPYVKHFPPETLMYAAYARFIEAGTCLGAYDDEQLVAIAIAEAQEWNRTLWIWEFGVLESHRRRGIGLRMMDELAIRSQNMGLRIMLVETQNTNGPAIRFYRRAGFTFDALDLTCYSNNDDLDDEIALFLKRKVT
ncbi:MAG: GNAT family N-acetyltransferase [Anaerolineae bacterium]|nr:GNAT family N-acetyltransferase [Anaerolineae bacterium]